ncbi:MAG: lamin tail domain-containing protein [Candidatus Krumholzibacteria bacterium]|jgi:hypothetical protein|nr:lamin tail domain-containing protein [Candidatus Krumholzibacteria bacterium]
MSRVRSFLQRRPGLVPALVLILLWPIAALAQDARPRQTGEAVKLLITEVAVQGTDQEFIEIYNPNVFDVDLSDYYLTDAIHAPDSQFYWRITEGSPSAATIGGGVFNDFHARFPDGYVLPAGEVIVISVAGSTPFFNHFGVNPDLELQGTGPATKMRPVFGDPEGSNSIVGTTAPLLTNASESLVLYYWDGASDLVTDIDVFFWGTSTNTRFSKTGVTVGEATYQDETIVENQQPITTSTAFGSSYHRISLTETGQPGPPGNGVDARDEVGEPFMSTFTVADYTPGQLPEQAQLEILSASVLNATAGAEITVRAQVQPGSEPIDTVTLYYSVNGGVEQDEAASDAGGGYWEAGFGQHTAGTEIAWRLVASDTGDGEAVWPEGGGTLEFTVSEPSEPGTAYKLLITEIATLGTDQEFVEIYNPNEVAVDLSDYYLTDAIYATGNQFYWRIAEGSPSQLTVGGGDFYDFHARFPDGFTIAAGGSIVVSIAGSTPFFNHFGFYPDLELFGTGPAPRMRPVFGAIDGPNSIVGSSAQNPPTLTNTSEVVVLYYWDGESDLVTDIDVFFWGTTVSTRFCKTGVTVGGETYQNETAVESQQPFLTVPDFGFSYHRVDMNETGQPGPPGNGVDARDEVGEPLPSTFAILAYDPAQPSAEGPPQILSASVQNPYSEGDVTLRIRVQAGTEPISAVTVYYTIDGGAELSLEAVDAGGGYWEANLGEFPAGTVIAWRVVVGDQGGGEAVYPAGGGTETVTIADPPEPGEAHKLLITEISILGTDQEYVEIANPNGFAVDLSDYYLTDAIYATGSQYYWRIAEGNPSQGTIGGGDFYDFHARFPAGFTIAAGDTIVVSIAGSLPYYDHFGFLPHLELFGTGPAPRMRPVFGDPDGPNSIVGSSDQNPPTLTNTSETIVLYYWDGVSNLVTDVDVFFWGDVASNRFSKTGVTIGGETYQNETAVTSQQPFLESPAFGSSYHRIDMDETGQPGPPGNGVAGRDEVGEPLPSTFAILAYDPARPREGGPGVAGAVTLTVPPKTFLPDLEEFVFSFTTNSRHETKLRIFDLDGRLVLSLYDSRYNGRAPVEVRWDGRDSTFERVRAGMYVIHLQAVDPATGKRTIKTAPVVVATRLK